MATPGVYLYIDTLARTHNCYIFTKDLHSTFVLLPEMIQNLKSAILTVFFYIPPDMEAPKESLIEFSLMCLLNRVPGHYGGTRLIPGCCHLGLYTHAS